MTAIRSNSGFIIESDIQPILDVDEEASIASDESIEAISSKKWSIVGGILALSSSIVYTFYGLLIKEFNLDFVDNMVVRSVLQIPLVVIFVKLRGKNILLEFPEHATKREKVKKYMVLIGAGILTGLNTMCSYLGVLYIPLGDAMTIIYTAPIFTMVFSLIFLRIRQGIWKIFFALILMIGVILVIRPPFLFPHHLENLQLRSTNQTLMVEFITKNDQNIYWIGVAICIGAASCTGLMNVVFNYLKDVDSGVMMFWSGLISILCSFVFLCFDQNSQIFFKHNIDWILLGHLSALAVVGISAVWMVTLSCQLIDPTISSVLGAQQVIFAYVAQTIVTHQMPQYLTFIGAGFVLLSAVCMTLEKWVKSRLPERLNSFV